MALAFRVIFVNALLFPKRNSYFSFYVLQRLRQVLSDFNHSNKFYFYKYYRFYIYTNLHPLLNKIHVAILHTILMTHTQTNGYIYLFIYVVLAKSYRNSFAVA
jgi:hypothetical protein